MKFGFLTIDGRKAGIWSAFIMLIMVSVVFFLGGRTLYQSAYNYVYEDELLAEKKAYLAAQQEIEQKEKEQNQKMKACNDLALQAAVEARERVGGTWEDGAIAMAEAKKNCTPF